MRLRFCPGGGLPSYIAKEKEGNAKDVIIHDNSAAVAMNFSCEGTHTIITVEDKHYVFYGTVPLSIGQRVVLHFAFDERHRDQRILVGIQLLDKLGNVSLRILSGSGGKNGSRFVR